MKLLFENWRKYFEETDRSEGFFQIIGFIYHHTKEDAGIFDPSRKAQRFKEIAHWLETREGEEPPGAETLLEEIDKKLITLRPKLLNALLEVGKTRKVEKRIVGGTVRQRGKETVKIDHVEYQWVRR